MNLFAEPADHAIGRSHGGLSTKIHALVDGKGRPLVLLVALGQGEARLNTVYLDTRTGDLDRNHRLRALASAIQRLAGS